MTGPSSEQLQLQQEQIDFYQQGMKQSQETFAQQQELLKQMESVYGPILAKGPEQEGFTGQEKEALQAESIEGTARNYTHASQALGEKLAAEGGDNPLLSGSEASLEAGVAESAAGEQSREQTQIIEADYAQGAKNFEEATAAIETASGQLNPVAFENAATSAGSSAETTAKDINAEENSWLQPVLGAVGALGGAVIDQNPKGIFG